MTMKNLALSSASGTSSSIARTSNQTLYTQYRAQIDAIANASNFNSNNLLNGSLGTANFQVGINAGKNAGLLAIQILATDDKNLKKKLIAYKKKLAGDTKTKGEKLLKLGYKKYLEK